MLILYAIMIGSLSLSHLTANLEASAIKGHARPHEVVQEGRSIKLSPATNQLDKQAKSVQQPIQQSTPILESTKRIYNDESIRRLVAQQPPVPVAEVQAAPVVPVAPVVSPVKPVEQPAVVPVAAPVVQPAASVVTKEVVPAPVQIEAKSAAEPAAKPAEPAAKQAEPVVKQAEPVAKSAAEPIAKPAESAKAAEELPPQSDRSAPIKPAIVEQPARVEAVPVPQAAAPVAPVVPVVVEEQKESALQAKKDVVVEQPAAPKEEPLHIEVPAPDPGLVLSEPIDSTTKLLIDLDEHVQKFLPVEDQQASVQQQPPKDPAAPIAGIDYSPPQASPAEPSGKSSGPLVPYSSVGADEPIVPPLPSLEGVEKASAAGSQAAVVGSAAAAPASPSSSSSSSVPTSSATRQGGQHQNQQQVISQLLDQLDTLQNRIQDTINQLVARRRYVMSALLRPMGTYVRRVRTNLERLQNRVNQLQAAAVSVGGGNNRPGGFVDAAAIETIRRRIDDISKRISEIVNRIRFSLTPTSAPLNSNGRNYLKLPHPESGITEQLREANQQELGMN